MHGRAQEHKKNNKSIEYLDVAVICVARKDKGKRHTVSQEHQQV